jgi:hypothetical protein
VVSARGEREGEASGGEGTAVTSFYELATMSEKYRGLKVVELNRKALMRAYAKKFYKAISKSDVKAISFVIERERGWNIQSSHADDIEASEVFAKAAWIMREP